MKITPLSPMLNGLTTIGNSLGQVKPTDTAKLEESGSFELPGIEKPDFNTKLEDLPKPVEPKISFTWEEGLQKLFNFTKEEAGIYTNWDNRHSEIYRIAEERPLTHAEKQEAEYLNKLMNKLMGDAAWRGNLSVF